MPVGRVSLAAGNELIPSSRRTLAYSLPQTLGLFLRVLLAVGFLLLTEQRVGGYDALNAGFVLLITLFAFRMPYVNSYAALFEFFSVAKWSAARSHAGLQKHADISQNALLLLSVQAAYIGGGIGAAALRVLMDVAYGVEYASPSLPGGSIEPTLSVSADALREIDTFWGTEKRLERLATAGLLNGTRSESIPLGSIEYMGLDSAAVVVWYLAEEVGFVALLSVCYVHVWLGSGLAKNRMRPLDPFEPEFWKRLFRLCFLLALVATGLGRCFPTAHGSLHVTVYRCQYQAWNPTVRLVDADNMEPALRVLGGLVGLLVALFYNRLLISTRESAEDGDYYYYRLVWGREPPAISRPDEASRRRGMGGGGGQRPEQPRDGAWRPPCDFDDLLLDDDAPWDHDDGRGWATVMDAAGGAAVRRRYANTSGYRRKQQPSGQAGCGGDSAASVFCVTRCCAKHPDGVGCGAECQHWEETPLASGFKLRIPHILDHPK